MKVRNIFNFLFLYPQKRIIENFDYDQYWKFKSVSAVSVLTPWQACRAKLAARYISGDALTICDIGCGDGGVLAFFKKNTNSHQLIGTDISNDILERAAAIGIDTMILDISQKDNLKNIPYADFIILFEIIEHVSHSEELVRSAFEHSKKGVFISVPNTGYFMHRLRLLFGKFPLQWRVHPGEHMRFWTAADMRWWLRAMGFVKFHHHLYFGIPILSGVAPSLFAAGQFVFIPKK
jgi:2-polyprenyl-3-methyl-5-hydroxy-6-metoxy-1,4-benzoquinol methylase